MTFPTAESYYAERSEIFSQQYSDMLAGVYDNQHGAPPPNDSYSSYLIPYDHDLRYLDATCIDSEELASTIRKMEAKKVIVILDACHTGGVKQYGAKTGAAGNTGLVEAYEEAFQKAEGQALLLSSDMDRPRKYRPHQYIVGKQREL